MSNKSARWAARALIAGILLVGTVVLGAGAAAAGTGDGPGQNGTSWSGGSIHG